jgi:hypothetical protein
MQMFKRIGFNLRLFHRILSSALDHPRMLFFPKGFSSQTIISPALTLDHNVKTKQNTLVYVYESVLFLKNEKAQSSQPYPF